MRRRLGLAVVVWAALVLPVSAQPRPGSFTALRATQLTVNGVGIVGTDGKIPIIDSTTFANLSGFNLTSLNATNMVFGAVQNAVFLGTYSNALSFTNASNNYVGSGVNVSGTVTAGVHAGGSFTGTTYTGTTFSGTFLSSSGAITATGGITGGSFTGGTFNGSTITGTALVGGTLTGSTLVTSSTIRATGGYLSPAGVAGASATCAGVPTSLTVAGGIITAITC